MDTPTRELKALPPKFFVQDTRSVAKKLLGKKVVKESNNRMLTGEIVETEAYFGKGDPSSHASVGKTERNEIMWKRGGLCYVYLVYGIHYMLNATTEEEETPGAVLIRALHPLRGMKYMKENRNVDREVELTNGPGKLTEALNIGMDMNYTDLTEIGSLWIARGRSPAGKDIESSHRIGVNEIEPAELRFFLKEDNFVSD